MRQSSQIGRPFGRELRQTLICHGQGFVELPVPVLEVHRNEYVVPIDRFVECGADHASERPLDELILPIGEFFDRSILLARRAKRRNLTFVGVDQLECVGAFVHLILVVRAPEEDCELGDERPRHNTVRGFDCFRSRAEGIRELHDAIRYGVAARIRKRIRLPGELVDQKRPVAAKSDRGARRGTEEHDSIRILDVIKPYDLVFCRFTDREKRSAELCHRRLAVEHV